MIAARSARLLSLTLSTALLGCAQPRDAAHTDVPIVVRRTDTMPPPPRISAFVAGASLIGVVVSVDSIEVGWVVGHVKAIAAADTAESRVNLSRRQLSDTAWLQAQPGSRYAVTAQLVGTTTPERESAWTPGVELTSAAAPSTAPRAPDRLAAVAASPYAVRLTWRDRSTDEYGFAIERASAGSRTFVRVGIVQTNSTTWVHGGLDPGASGTYRVVSFNPVGISAPTASAQGETFTDVGRATAEPMQGELVDTIGDCLRGAIDLEATESAMSGLRPRLYRNVPFGEHRVDMLIDLCGNANCNVMLYSQLRGCKREIGDLFFIPGDSAQPGWTVRAVDRDGWPIIATIAHSSYSSFSVSTLQLIRDRYRYVDGYFHCGAVHDLAWTASGGDAAVDGEDPLSVDLRKLRPPFTGCQFEDPPSRSAR